jgi:Fur family ferric uptake transcriptional regulator
VKRRHRAFVTAGGRPGGARPRVAAGWRGRAAPRYTVSQAAGGREGAVAVAGQAADLEAAFAARGGELTPARRHVLQMIPRAVPFRPEALWRQVRAAHPELGRATVFRTLRLLRDLGLLERVADPAGDGYRLCPGCAEGHHHHLRCVDCGRDTLVEGEVLRRLEEALVRAQAAYGFVPVAHSLDLVGRCARCAAAPGRPAPGGA